VVVEKTSMLQIPNAGSWIGEVGVRIEQFTGSTLDMYRSFANHLAGRDDPIATIELCAHESGAENQQEDERVAEKREIVCRKRFIESPQRRDFEPCPAATPIDRDRSPPDLRVPGAPDPVGQTQSCGMSQTHIGLLICLGIGFHKRRLSSPIGITAARVTKLGRLSRASQLVRHRARTTPPFLPRPDYSRRSSIIHPVGVGTVLP